MYFPDHELNKRDRLLQGKTPAEQAQMTAWMTGTADDGLPVYTFDITP